MGGDDLADAVRRCLCFDQIPQTEDIRSLYETSNAVFQRPSNQPDSPPPQSDSTPPQSDDTPQQSDSAHQQSSNTTSSGLSAWWKKITEQNNGTDPIKSDDIYDKILAR